MHKMFARFEWKICFMEIFMIPLQIIIWFKYTWEIHIFVLFICWTEKNLSLRFCFELLWKLLNFMEFILKAFIYNTRIQYWVQFNVHHHHNHRKSVFFLFLQRQWCVYLWSLIMDSMRKRTKDFNVTSHMNDY